MENNQQNNQENNTPVENIPTPEVSAIPAIHTYAGDLANARNSGAVIPENGKGSMEFTSSKKDLLYAIGILVFIALGIGGVWYGNKKNIENSTPVQIMQDTKTLVAHDTITYIDGINIVGGENTATVLNKIVNEAGALDSIKAIVLYSGTQTNKMDAGAVFRMMNANVPDGLLKALSGKVMLGAYIPKDKTEKHNLFFVLEVKDYDTAIAGMTTWEKTIGDDFSAVFGITNTTENTVLNKNFEDTLIENNPVRVLKDSNGNPQIYTIFLNNQFIVLTNGANALTELRRRIITDNATPLQ